MLEVPTDLKLKLPQLGSLQGEGPLLVLRDWLAPIARQLCHRRLLRKTPRCERCLGLSEPVVRTVQQYWFCVQTLCSECRFQDMAATHRVFDIVWRSWERPIRFVSWTLVQVSRHGNVAVSQNSTKQPGLHRGAVQRRLKLPVLHERTQASSNRST